MATLDHRPEPRDDAGLLLPVFALALLVGVAVIALMGAMPSAATLVGALGVLIALTAGIVVLLNRMLDAGDE